MSCTGQFLFLGTGSSSGVPVVGCSCKVCSSTNPKNQRLRSSGLLSFQNHSLLIDPGPDFRQQALRYKIASLDSILVSHTHYDHIGGLEELRVFTLNRTSPLPCYLSSESLESVKKMFYYHFLKKEKHFNYRAEFNFHVLEGDSGAFAVGDALIRYMKYQQGGTAVLGFRVGDFAYITDLKEYDESLLHDLHGVKTVVTSALRFTKSRLQMNVDEAVSFINAVGAKEGYISHMSHDIDYDVLTSRLPPHIKPAYDGLQLTFSW